MSNVNKIDELLHILAVSGRKEDGVKMLQVLNDPTISNTMIARMLSTVGYKIERKSVRSWRRKNGFQQAE